MRYLFLACLAVGGCGTSTGGDDMGVGDLTMLPEHCSNGMKDADESDLDCGGSCGACGTGKGCKKGSDCASLFCANNLCDAPSCTDGVKNGDESDLDCGGMSCAGCAPGKGCRNGFDCAGNMCVNNVCKGGVGCTDTAKNGTETDVDCGGGGCPMCADGKDCLVGADCTSGSCVNLVCAPMVNCMAGTGDCDGNAQNGCETDVTSDPKNCGGCGSVCPMNAPSCSAGKCTSIACPNGIHFALPVAYPSNGNGRGIAVADFNKDGRPDVASVTDNKSVVSIFLNNGGGVLAPKVGYQVQSSGTHFVAAGDLDGDGAPDLAVPNGGISTLANQGGGVFAPHVDYFNLPISGPKGIVIADFDGDKKPDVAFSNYGKNNVGLFYNQGGGVLGNFITFPTDIAPYGLVAPDMNGDGKPDLVTANYANLSVNVLINQGNGFAPKVTYPTAQGASMIAAGDLDGDGKPDIAVTNNGNSSISVLRNMGGGVLGPSVQYTTRPSPSGIAIGDLDGDGKPDLAVAPQQGDVNGCYMNVLRNTGNGFGPALDVPSGMVCPSAVAAADMNGDGKLDLVVENGGQVLHVFLNDCK